MSLFFVVVVSFLLANKKNIVQNVRNTTFMRYIDKRCG